MKMPPKGKNAGFSLSDVARITVLLFIMMIVIVGALGVDLGGLRWEPYESRPDFTLTFTGSSANNSVFFDNGDIVGYHNLSDVSSVTVGIKIQVFCSMVNGSYFQMGELIEGVWENKTMQDEGNKTWTTTVAVDQLQHRTFCLFYIQPNRVDITCSWVLEDNKGIIVVKPVGGG